MCHEISTKYQMTCVTLMNVVTPKTRLSKAHTGYGTHFLPDLGLFHKWLSSPLMVFFPQSTPCLLTLDLHVSSLPPKAFWCPSPLCKFHLPFKAQFTNGASEPQSGDICSRTEGRRK